MSSRLASKPLGGAENFFTFSSFFSPCARAGTSRQPSAARASNIPRIIAHLLGHEVTRVGGVRERTSADIVFRQSRPGGFRRGEVVQLRQLQPVLESIRV